jgi:hypothetical protein
MSAIEITFNGKRSKNRKHTLIICIFLLPFFVVNGQQPILVVDAGNDTCVCIYNEVVLGGNPTVQGGTPPYTYCWYGVYEIFPGLIYQYASDILNDTTLANPTIIGTNTSLRSYVINLMVTDAVGNRGWSSVVVFSTHYFCAAWTPDATIIQGDSVMLFDVCTRGIEPHTYLWSPPDGLSDPTNGRTYASPVKTTMYSMDMWDSCGCSLGLQGSSYFLVIVIPSVGLDPVGGNDEYKIMPNPNPGIFKIQSDQFNMTINIQIYNTMGVVVSDLYIKTNETVDFTHLHPGLYFMQIKADLKKPSVLKMIIE